MGRPKKTTPRDAFIAGKAPAYSAGQHGCTVRVWVEAGVIKVRGHDPVRRKRQKTLFEADSALLRGKAADVADAAAEELQKLSTDNVEKAAREDRPPPLALLTVFDVCYWYMRRIPGYPRDLMRGTQGQIERWYSALPAEVRGAETTPSPATAVTDILAFKRLWASPQFSPERLVLEIEPGDATEFAASRIAGRTYSPRTMASTVDRLSSAFEYIINQFPRSVGLARNPIRGRKLDRSKARIPMYTPEEIRKLQETARELLTKHHGRRGYWRLFVYLEIASSMRRRGSILSLTAADHDFDKDTVTWRAEFAKGNNYGRGDDVRPLTSPHRAAALWAIEHHPNPLGPAYPMLYQETNPARRLSDSAIDKLFRRLERMAGVEHLPGRLTHSMRRAVATILAEMFGDEAAAEFGGMKPKTLREYHYKQIVPATMRKVAGGVGEVFGGGSSEGFPADQSTEKSTDQ